MNFKQALNNHFKMIHPITDQLRYFNITNMDFIGQLCIMIKKCIVHYYPRSSFNMATKISI